MPKRNTNTRKTAAAARANGLKASKKHTLRAAEKRFGILSAKEQDQVLTAAERYAKARADKEESIASIKNQEDKLKSKELIPAQTVRFYVLSLVAGLRREVDSIPVTIQGITVPTDATDQLRMCITAIQKRMRERFAAMPEWFPGDQKAGA